eukprot:3491661-Prymnesium_polylepis.1
MAPAKAVRREEERRRKRKAGGGTMENAIAEGGGGGGARLPGTNPISQSLSLGIRQGLSRRHTLITMSHSAPLTDTSGPVSNDVHMSYLISTLTVRTRHTKRGRTTSLPGGPGEASSAVG